MKHYVGVIGFGGEGYWQARHAEQSDVLELVGVSDISEKRKEFAAEKNIKFCAQQPTKEGQICQT